MQFKEEKCSCGKKHFAPDTDVLIGSGVIEKIADVLKSYNAGKVFILADENTYETAGKKVCGILDENDMECSKYIFSQKPLEPDEWAVGCAVMHFDNSCDAIVGIGSGVINDIGKILSNMANKIYIIVATAPSMDGYASATSSMSMNGLKVSLNSKCANVIIGDTDILSAAPVHMLKAGIGDMLAKYISICEWRIANIITGEYYCGEIAEFVRSSLKHCIGNAPLLLKRDKTAVEAVFRGLVSCGIAMAYAGVSRPASGIEHYFSHIWDMRGLEFKTNVDLHGIQCGVATLISARLYEKIKQIKPDREKALNSVAEFDFDIWSNQLKDFIGKGAQSMIESEEKDQKYSIEKHMFRLDIILKDYDKIIEIINEEIPPAEEIEKLLDIIDAPKAPEQIGIDPKTLPMTFLSTKDIRDKYVLSRLAWDLGILDEIL